MRKLVMAAMLAAGSLSACVGSTEPATNVSTLSAQLNAKGFTNDGPATWWWEYDTVKSDLGTANDTEVCGSATRCGPATAGSAGSPIRLSVTVTGLTPNTTYYFRACGQDTNDTQPSCAATLSFKTLAGTAYQYVTKWSPPLITNSDGYTYRPLAGPIEVDANGTVYVGTSSGGIEKFDGSGRFVGALGEDALDIAIDPSGNVLALEVDSLQFDWRIRRFTSAGALISQFGGTVGFGNGQFTVPYGIDTDSNGNLYVADTYGQRVQVLAPDGTYLRQWGSKGTADGQFGVPLAAAVGNGIVYVTDGGVGWNDLVNARVQAFSPNGTFLFKWNLGDSHGADVDSAGYLLVAGASLKKVVRYNALGGPVATIDPAGTTDPGGFDDATAVAADRLGNVFVVDYKKNQILKFRPVQ